MRTTLAAAITKAASKQTYYTIRFLVDRARVEDGYRAYAYFRWVDDLLDAQGGSATERRAFLERQEALLEQGYRGEMPLETSPEENLLLELIRHDPQKNSGLALYLRNLMWVIDFDVRRRGRLISQAELDEYTRRLALAVTEAMHYFIGHDQPTAPSRARYLAVTGAHIVHMLRDTLEDIEAGYFNIPREYLAAEQIGPQDVDSEAYRAWVRLRAEQARAYFQAGKDEMARMQNIRRRIAGYAYIARFEAVLDSVERLGYRLAPEAALGQGLGAGARMSGSLLSLAFFPPAQK